jgi:hypothetical protein
MRLPQWGAYGFGGGFVAESFRGDGDLSSTRDCLEKDVVQFVFTGWSRGWQGRLVCFVGGFGTLKY